MFDVFNDPLSDCSWFFHAGKPRASEGRWEERQSCASGTPVRWGQYRWSESRSG
jgi:hypothetical protein